MMNKSGISGKEKRGDNWVVQVKL